MTGAARRVLVVLALTSAMLVARPSAAEACSCGQPQPCLALGMATVVFVGTVTRAESIPRRENNGRLGFRRFMFDVERTFRNTTSRYRRDPKSPRPVVELTAWGEGAGCVYGFEQGRRYLVFAREEQGFLIAGLCSGTSPLDRAKQYLDFLDRPPARPQAGRVSGVVYLDTRDNGPLRKLPALKVVLRGDRFTRETMTDEHARFEFVDVPAQRFTVAAVPPPPFIATREVVQESPDPRQCTVANLPVRYDGRISGVVRDRAGTPVPHMRVQARRPEGYEALGESTTDAAGKYVLNMLSPGKYLVGVNIARAPTIQSPYDATSHAISLVAGQHLGAAPLQLPRRLATLELSGCATWPDKTPVRNGWVVVEATRDRSGADIQRVNLDAGGCFSVDAVEGNRYSLTVWAVIPPEWPIRTVMSQQTVDPILRSTQLTFVLTPPRTGR